MDRPYGITSNEVQAVRDKTEASLELVAAQLGSHLQIVAMTVVMIVAERLGRDGLDDIVDVARSLRRALQQEGSPSARAMKIGQRRRHGPKIR